MDKHSQVSNGEIPQGDILSYIADTKTAGDTWGLTDERVKQLAREGLIKAKKIGTSWAIDMRQNNPKTYRKEKECINYVSET